MEIVLIAVVIVLAAFIGIGLYTALKILYPKMKDDAYFEWTRNEYNQYDKKWYDSLKTNEFFIKSKYGYDIHATYVKNDNPTEHTIIICHGVTSRTDGVRKFLKMFIDNGYNALFIDHRAHGKSGGKKVSYGYFEKYDLAEAIKWVKNKHTGKIGLIGESMGSGISMQTLAVEEVDFLVEDCGYSAFDEEVKHQFRDTKFIPLYPSYWVTRLLVRLIGGYDLKKVSSLEALKQTNIPIMVVHGQEDNYVPFYMSSIIYDNIKSEHKMFFAAEGTRHALAYEDHPKEYEEQVYAFLKACNLPHAENFVA